MTEFSLLDTSRKILNFLRFTGFFSGSFVGNRIIVKPSTVVIFLTIISCLIATLVHSWMSFDISQISILNVGNQLIANNVILIAIFTMIFNFRNRVEIFESFIILDSVDDIVSINIFYMTLNLNNRR